MLQRLAGWLTRFPLLWVSGWAAIALILLAMRPSYSEITASEPGSFLGDDQPYSRATLLERRAFPKLAARTQMVLVLHRPSGLTSQDWDYLKTLTTKLERPSEGHEPWRVQSPVGNPFLRSRLVSADNQAALIVLLVDAVYVSTRSIDAVRAAEAIAATDRPAGLTLEVTGTAGIGRDLLQASSDALHRSTWVTVTCVLVILLLVYRAPLAVLAPLLSIGLSAWAAMLVLDQLAVAGWGISNAERIFTIVLLFGSGTDFALFWIFRYRELWSDGASLDEAARGATTSTAPAIIVSAGTTICGVFTLIATDLLPTHNAGKALAVALSIELLAALTLLPAAAVLMRRYFFWPFKLTPRSMEMAALPAKPDSVAASASRRRPRWSLWQAISNLVTARPAWVIGGSVALLSVPVAYAAGLSFRYDTLGQLPAGSSSLRGKELAERHFEVGALFSTSLLVELPAGTPKDRLAEISQAMHLAVRDVPGVADVWSLTHPLGTRGSDKADPLTRAFLAAGASEYYVSDNPAMVRLEIMLTHAPLSNEAIETAGGVKSAASRACEQKGISGAALHLSGPTSYIMNVKNVAAWDQAKVMVLSVAVIWVIVLAYLRDWKMATFMLAATLTTYSATLGISGWFFTQVLGGASLDWKVRLFLFVVLVAVGQDYSLFLLSRLRDELRSLPPVEAAKTAIVRTGSVISNCGLVMAATLGSLASTGLDLLRQLGFAFALGILLDTFLVRPLLIPSFFLLLNRGRQREEQRHLAVET